MKASAEEALGTDSLKGLGVAVQGVGKVGRHLLQRLAEDDCRLYVSDVDQKALAWAVDEIGASSVPPEDIYDVECDIFSPNGLGGVLNDETIPRLNCRIVCGGANNQLAEERHASALAEHGILFAPDFVVNCGGIINAANELMGYNAERAEAMARRVYDTTHEVLAYAKAQGITPLAASRRLAEQRIQKVGRLRHYYLPDSA
jgi:leucine dehydrogenase